MGLEHLEALLTEAQTSGAPFDYGADHVQLTHLRELAARAGSRLICEVGFNCGFSSWAFLSSSPDVQVVSFELGYWGYTSPAKAHIDELFPGRHVLVRGDSRVTVPAFAAVSPQTRFDLLFVDGDHTREGAGADLRNLRPLAGPQALLVMDDMTPWRPSGVGPTQAWLEAVRAGLVEHQALFRDGVLVTTIEPPASRSWAIGRYA